MKRRSEPSSGAVIASGPPGTVTYGSRVTEIAAGSNGAADGAELAVGPGLIGVGVGEPDGDVPPLGDGLDRPPRHPAATTVSSMITTVAPPERRRPSPSPAFIGGIYGCRPGPVPRGPEC
jgi:hypothetical protein